MARRRGASKPKCYASGAAYGRQKGNQKKGEQNPRATARRVNQAVRAQGRRAQCRRAYSAALRSEPSSVYSVTGCLQPGCPAAIILQKNQNRKKPRHAVVQKAARKREPHTNQQHMLLCCPPGSRNRKGVILANQTHIWL